MELKWVCLYEDCGHVNLDDFLKTATPTCEICGQKYWWDQLLTPKEMAVGNVLLVSELKRISDLELNEETRGGELLFDADTQLEILENY